MQLHICKFPYLLGYPDEPLRHVLDSSCGNFCQTSYETLDGRSLFIEEGRNHETECLGEGTNGR